MNTPVLILVMLGCVIGLAGCPAGSQQSVLGITTTTDAAAGDSPETADRDSADGGVANGDAPVSSADATQTTLANLQVFPPDNPWNTDISAYPVHPNSANFLASIGLDKGLHPDFGTVWQGAPIGIPYTLVDSTTPLVPVVFDYADESDPGPYPIPPDALIEGGPEADGDRHVLLVDPARKMLYELFYAFPQPDGSWTAGSGAIWDLTSNELRPLGWTSADAAGLPIFAGLVRYDEVVEKGEIDHALRFTVSTTQKAYILPATHYASSSTDPNRPPMGLRVRLKADVDISGYSPNVQVMLRAMKKYGMLVADNGSDWFVSGVPDSRWDDDELHQLKQIKGHQFEVVYTGEPITD